MDHQLLVVQNNELINGAARKSPPRKEVKYMENGKNIGINETIEHQAERQEPPTNGVVFDMLRPELTTAISKVTAGRKISLDHMAHVGKVVSITEQLANASDESFDQLLAGILKAE